jgi:DnaK suppressor protein
MWLRPALALGLVLAAGGGATLASQGATPAAAASGKGFIWAIERAGKTGWIVGSLHLLPPEAYPLPASMDVNSRQGDLADQASGSNEVHIQLKLKQTDAKILAAIEEALYRMEKGTYGVCRDCGEQIAPARLNAIPWTRVCITCKEKQSA